VYTDDTILLGPDKDEIDLLVKRLSRSFKIEDQGHWGIIFPIFTCNLGLVCCYVK
jgi:hypothetical protein